MTVGMAEAKRGVAEAVCFRKGVSGSAGEKTLTLIAVWNKVQPFQTKAFPIWTRQVVCARGLEFKSLYPLQQAMRISEFGLQLKKRRKTYEVKPLQSLSCLWL